MDFHALLSDSSRKTADWIVSIIGDDPALFGRLVDLALEDKGQVSMRAARVAYLCCSKFPELICPHRNRLIQRLSNMKIDGVKREMIRLLAEQPFDYNEEEAGLLVGACFNWLCDPSEKVSLRIYSMDILYKASAYYPELKHELLTILEREIPRSSKAHGVRAGRMLKILKRDMKGQA